MPYIPISCPRIPNLRFIVDDDDAAACLDKHWNMSHRYAFFASGPACRRRQIYAHAFIMQTPEGMTVDHINGDTFDNRRSNLEIVSFDENRRRNCRRSIIRGVRFSPTLGKWCVFHRLNGNHRIVAVCDTMEAAIADKSAR